MLLSISVAIPAGAQQLDRIEGKWLGVAGTDLDRVAMGYEFRRDSTGAVIALLHLPVGNYYALPLPGSVQVDSGKYHVRSWGLTLAPLGDSLKGTLFFNRLPVSLGRAALLPTETPVPDLPPGPPLAWQVKLGAPIHAQAALQDGVAYIGTAGGLFHAVDVGSGSFRWTFAAGKPVFGAAAVSQDAVYFVCDNGYLFKLGRSDGREIWRYDLGDGRTSRVLMHQVLENSGEFDWDMAAPTPVIDGGTIYVGSGDGSMHAVNAESGQLVWRHEAKGKVRGTAVLRGNRLVFGTWDGMVIALDRATGKKQWEWNSRGPIVSSVAVIDDRIVAGNRYGILAALDAATGQPAWRMQLWGSSAESTAEPAGGTRFYFGSSDLRRIALMDARDGRVLWRTDVLGWAWARPIVHGNLLLASTVGAQPYQMRHLGGLVALDRSNGKILWRMPVTEPPGAWGYGFFAPAAADGAHIVIGGLDGSLYGLRLR
jgi:outer membrane protein assembly factor BamB